jgi:hypothetical protein
MMNKRIAAFPPTHHTQCLIQCMNIYLVVEKKNHIYDEIGRSKVRVAIEICPPKLVDFCPETSVCIQFTTAYIHFI